MNHVPKYKKVMRIYPTLFAKFYDGFIKSFEDKIAPDRNSYLKDLKGRIVDVGSGTGANFKFFNTEAEILAVEPSIEMLNKSKVKIDDKNITLINLGINDIELDNYIAVESVDTIVCTLVLCTIPNPKSALLNFKKWLKPGGQLIIIEHVHSENAFNAKFQNLINPVWRKFAEGCNLNRDTDKLLLESGFKSENATTFHLGLRLVKGIYTL